MRTEKPKTMPLHHLSTEEIVKRELGGATHNPFAAFTVSPRRASFETQELKEHIVLMLRMHWYTNVGWVITTIFMILAPLVLLLVPFLELMPFRFQFVAVVIWYMMTLAFVLENFLSWYFNVYLITDERLVDIDFYSLLYKRISETKINRIQDVSYSQAGIIQAIFDYGNVVVQTAGEIPEFDLFAVPHPAKVAKVLNQLVLQEEQETIEGRIH